MAGTNPRAARIAALIQRVVASSIERELHDKRLASITVTEVRVTNDLQIAKVYWTQLGHEATRKANASAPSRHSIRPRATCDLWWATRLACA